MLDTLSRRLAWPLDRRRGDTGRERPVVTPAKARASETHSNAVFQSDRVRLDGHGRAGRLVPLPRAWSNRFGLVRDIAVEHGLSCVLRPSLDLSECSREPQLLDLGAGDLEPVADRNRR